MNPENKDFLVSFIGKKREDQDWVLVNIGFDQLVTFRSLIVIPENLKTPLMKLENAGTDSVKKLKLVNQIAFTLSQRLKDKESYKNYLHDMEECLKISGSLTNLNSKEQRERMLTIPHSGTLRFLYEKVRTDLRQYQKNRSRSMVNDLFYTIRPSCEIS